MAIEAKTMEREVETLMGMMPRMRKMLKESDAQEVENHHIIFVINVTMIMMMMMMTIQHNRLNNIIINRLTLLCLK